MAEKTIQIEGIEPRDLFGTQSANINHINSKFPTMKIVVRGGALRVAGTDQQVALYEDKLLKTITYYNKYGHLSPEILDHIYDSSPLSGVATTDEQIAQAKDVIVFGVNGNVVRAVTKNQQKLVDAYQKNDLMFAIGPAGSGKTYTAIALAVRALKNREVKKIILTRPAVEAGEKLGFLPGDMKEKLDPYLQPLYDALQDMIPAKKLAEMMDEGAVQIAPLAYMRGRTLDNAFVILDEAQNTSTEQLKMFLTRMGRTAKFIVTGDLTQIDLQRKCDSGLAPTLDRLHGIKGISIIEFDGKDILRHPLVVKIVAAFEK
ncbi:MAG: PhoH family protein [Mucinivorans sp.]